jgi:RNA-binding protein
MPQILLTPAQRREHRANAHHLDPVVMIGGDGLTPAVQKEIDSALASHGLIKVRYASDDRQAREQAYQSVAAELGAAPIQHIGKLFILWRPPVEKVKERSADEERRRGPMDVKVLKNSTRGGQRPEVRTLRVLGNERLTQGGIVKRAKKPKQKSIKRSQGN